MATAFYISGGFSPMKIAIISAFFVESYCCSFMSGQCPGFNNFRNPGASTNVNPGGVTPWEFPYPSTKFSDNAYTNMRIGTTATSQYLSVYSWGYSFTTGTVCGIKVRVEKSAPATNPGIVTDLEAKLFNGASYSPNNYADAVTPWPTADAYFTYGGNADLWGFASITAAQINSVNFAFRFRAQRTDLNDSAKIDHVEMTAYSDELLPVELLSFDAIKDIENRAVDLKWKCASETNNHFFTVERSKDYEKWEQVRVVNGAGNSSVVTSYEITDIEPFPGQSYYRLSQTDFDGTTKMLDMISVRFKNYLDDLVIYPSLAHDFISIKAQGDINKSTLVITDISGRELRQVAVNEGYTVYESMLDISMLSSGVYLLKMINGDFQICNKFVKY